MTPQTNDLAALKTRFEAIVGERIKRDDIGDLMDYLEKSDFYTAPASSRFHGAWPGGLVQHSLDTYDEIMRLYETAFEGPLNDYCNAHRMIPSESLTITSLFHDLCKVNFYKPEKRNRKNEDGQWESYDSYIIDEKYKFGGHGSKSVYMIQNFIHLRPEEAAAINCHMGIGDGSDHISEVYERNPLAFAVHVADEAACYIMRS